MKDARLKENTNCPAEITGCLFDSEYLKNDLKGRSIRGGAVTMTAQAVKFLLHMGSMVVLARLLTPQDFGLIAMITAVTGFITMFKDMGLSTATIQKDQINHDQISTLFWINTVIGIALAILTAALAPGIAWFYGEPRLTVITMALAIAFIFSGLTIQHQALLRRHMRYITLAAIECSAILIGVLAAIIAAFYGARYWSLVIMQLATGCVNAAGVWLASGWRPGQPIRKSGIRGMLTFGGHLTGFNFINYAASHIDQILIGRYFGKLQLGFYNRAYSLLLFPLRQLNQPVNSVLTPAMSRIVDTSHRYRRAYFQSLNCITTLIIPGVSFLIATSDWIIPLVLGPQWNETAKIFAILGFGGLILPILSPLGILYVTQGRTRDMLYVGFIDACVKITSIIIGLFWGVTGVAVAVAVRYYIEAPFLIWFCCRKGPIRIKDFLPTFLYAGSLSILVMASLTAFRHYFNIRNPLLGSLISFGIVAIITLTILLIVPNIRSMIKGILISLFYSFSNNKKKSK